MTEYLVVSQDGAAWLTPEGAKHFEGLEAELDDVRRLWQRQTADWSDQRRELQRDLRLLKAQLADADADRLVKQGEIDDLRKQRDEAALRSSFDREHDTEWEHDKHHAEHEFGVKCVPMAGYGAAIKERDKLQAALDRRLHDYGLDVAPLKDEIANLRFAAENARSEFDSLLQHSNNQAREIEQRKRLHEQDDAVIVSLRAEVERLKLLGPTQGAWKDEVEQLRDELNREKEAAHNLAFDIERLRAERDQAIDDRIKVAEQRNFAQEARKKDDAHYRATIERLRAELDREKRLKNPDPLGR